MGTKCVNWMYCVYVNYNCASHFRGICDVVVVVVVSTFIIAPTVHTFANTFEILPSNNQMYMYIYMHTGSIGSMNTIEAKITKPLNKLTTESNKYTHIYIHTFGL